MQQPEVLNELRRTSARVGRNILLVQGAGGNSSIKHGDALWVKASGTWLADAADKEIFVPVSLSGARAALAAGDERMPLASGHPESQLRASIETSLHALMAHPVVLHVHSVNTIAWSVRSDAGDELVARLRGLRWRRLDYHHPGLPLAQAVSKSLALEPRGAAGTDGGSLHRICAGSEYRLPQDPLCHTLGTDHHNFAIATKGSLYPDHVVFLGPALPVLSEGEDLTAKVALADARGYLPPVAVIVPGKGTVIRKDASAGAEAMLSCLALVTSRLPRNATIKYLTSRDEQALLNWDAEHYRQQMTDNR
jgi:rhamnose utilization protein RhaD (predicted bifunctional aldolase and dehydrogenase)